MTGGTRVAAPDAGLQGKREKGSQSADKPSICDYSERDMGVGCPFCKGGRDEGGVCLPIWGPARRALEARAVQTSGLGSASNDVPTPRHRRNCDRAIAAIRHSQHVTAGALTPKLSLKPFIHPKRKGASDDLSNHRRGEGWNVAWPSSENATLREVITTAAPLASVRPSPLTYLGCHHAVKTTASGRLAQWMPEQVRHDGAVLGTGLRESWNSAQLRVIGRSTRSAYPAVRLSGSAAQRLSGSAFAQDSTDATPAALT